MTTSERQGLRRASGRKVFAAVLLLAGCVVVAYWQALGHSFINLDDPAYVTSNPRVQAGLTGDNLLWALRATAASNWHPLTWVSHMVDVELFGVEPRGHHLMNVLLHALAAVLLFGWLLQATGAAGASFFVAGLFALHPLHVESVAWVAERKDVLSGALWFLTLLLYTGYARKRAPWRYLAALLAFAAGLMAKPMLVSLPLVLLLLDWWPLQRFRPLSVGGGDEGTPPGALLAEKVPFLALSGLSCVATLYAQSAGGAVKSLESVDLGLRFGNALRAYVAYLGKTIWPSGLSIFYPLSRNISFWSASGAGLLLVLFSWGAVQARLRRPYLLTGWFWFLITLVPVIGLVQVGGQAMADRYTYIPLTGIFLAVAWVCRDLVRPRPYREALLVGSAAVALSACAVATWTQLAYWKDSVTLYRRALTVAPRNFLIVNNYGIALAERGEFGAAIEHYREALRLWPDAPGTRVNLGAALARQGRVSEAVEQYREALKFRPDDRLAKRLLTEALATQQGESGARDSLSLQPNLRGTKSDR